MAPENDRSSPASDGDRTAMSPARRAAEQYFHPTATPAGVPPVVVVRRRLPSAAGPGAEPLAGAATGPTDPADPAAGAAWPGVAELPGTADATAAATTVDVASAAVSSDASVAPAADAVADRSDPQHAFDTPLAGGGRGHGDDADTGPAAPLPTDPEPARRSRVHRVDAPAAAVAEPAPATAALPPPRTRRRRDPTRAPRLISHVVLASSAPAANPSTGVADGGDADLAAARRALARIDALLVEIAALRAVDPLAGRRPGPPSTR